MPGENADGHPGFDEEVGGEFVVAAAKTADPGWARCTGALTEETQPVATGGRYDEGDGNAEGKGGV